MSLSTLIRYNLNGYSDRNMAMRRTASLCRCGNRLCLCCRVDRLLRRLDRMKSSRKLAT